MTIDVGHNKLSAMASVRALKDRFGDGERAILIYNSLKDKDYKSILEIFRDYIKRVEIIPIESDRAVDIEDLKRELKRASIDFKIFDTIDRNNNYLVFGSFLVVESFIKKYLL